MENESKETIEEVTSQETTVEETTITETAVEETATAEATVAEEAIPADETEAPLDKNVRMLSPGRMVARRFFKSKLSIVGLILIIGLFAFSWLGPIFYQRWGETEQDFSGKYTYDYTVTTVTLDDGTEYESYQVLKRFDKINSLAAPSADHLLGTDKMGMDIFTRLMYGGRISLSISFIAVFAIMIIGVIMGGLAGFFGGWVDTVIMRICDILMCLPTFPILLIMGSMLDAYGVAAEHRIYFLMLFLTIFSWSGTARLVRGQILSLREQEYMVAAEAMGFSSGRKIFKHLIPNVMPQLIVSMTLSLGSTILYEATLSYLNMGVRAPYAAWGTMINIISEDNNILSNYFNVWGPPGVCIILAVLGFNFIGDGLRDALDPKMKR